MTAPYHSASSALPSRPRPALFRALGKCDPPAQVQVGGADYRRITIFKHDSWAATALYENDSGQQVVCKFNRRQPILGIPMLWLGRLLARREAGMYARLAPVSQVPDGCGDVYVDGVRSTNAATHRFVAGTPLCNNTVVGDAFFDELESLVSRLHERRIAYVDLHKVENVIVGQDGRPYLIDFQISVHLPQTCLLNWLLGLLQRSDSYHVAKMKLRLRPDLCDYDHQTIANNRPWWIRLHRLVAVPFRSTRRRLLVLLGIRRASGLACTEYAPEDGMRAAAKPMVESMPPRLSPKPTAFPAAAYQRAA